MHTEITIQRPGLLSTLQDKGRFGHRHLGIPWSGCLTPGWQQIANTLVGNPVDHSVIETWEGGLLITVGDSAIRFAVVGDPGMKMTISLSGHTERVLPCQSYTVAAGSEITLQTTGQLRHAIIAFADLQSTPQLGSSSTYVKASLGGLSGEALKPGDALTVKSEPTGTELVCNNPLLDAYRISELRVVMGPQEDHFSPKGCENLLGSDYQLTAEADRMGVRLTGPEIIHRDQGSRDIVSDAIVPGSIQVPGSGQPIILLNDAHTAGGYPKIATVISIDLPLLGLQRAGATFRFRSLTIDQAINASREQHQLLRDTLAKVRPLINTSISNETLLSTNLIDGVTDGCSV